MPRAKQKAAASGGRLKAGTGKSAEAKAKPRKAAAPKAKAIAKAKATPMDEIAESAPEVRFGCADIAGLPRRLGCGGRQRHAAGAARQRAASSMQVRFAGLVRSHCKS